MDDLSIPKISTLSLFQSVRTFNYPNSKMQSVTLSARIRPFMPWESREHAYCIKSANEIVLPSTNFGRREAIHSRNQNLKPMEILKFNSIHDGDATNKAVFEHTVRKLCDNLIETGFNSMLIAYGQTGSGKTHSLLGDGDSNSDNQTKGILTMAIEYLQAHPSVSTSFLSVVEVYGTTVWKIKFFDLFDPQNTSSKETDADQDFKLNENGFGDLNSRIIIREHVTDTTDVGELIRLAQSAGHYAVTGRNTNSSRGHTAFIINVHLTDGHQCDFVCLDTAGSEGMSAITPNFIRSVGRETANIRRREAGVINYGLQQIQGILKEVGTVKGVKETNGNGVRKLLWPYLQKECQPMIHVLFTLSPSTTNLKTTRDTFRIAKLMANLNTKSDKEIIRDLMIRLKEQQKVITDLHLQNQTLEGKLKAIQNKQLSNLKKKKSISCDRLKRLEQQNGEDLEQQKEEGLEQQKEGDLEQQKVEDLEQQNVEDLERHIQVIKASLKDKLNFLKSEMQSVMEVNDDRTWKQLTIQIERAHKLRESSSAFRNTLIGETNKERFNDIFNDIKAHQEALG